MYPRRLERVHLPAAVPGPKVTGGAATAFDPERWTTICLLLRRGAGEQLTETECHVLVSLRLENAASIAGLRFGGLYREPPSVAAISDGQGNQANVIETDIDASNGVIHAIDAVLLPAQS